MNPDFEDLSKTTRELEKLSIQLSQMVSKVADARTVIEFNSDRKKAALSKAVLLAFKGGANSTSRAEHEAMGSAKFEQDLDDLSSQYAAAERVRTEYEVTKIKVESLRSLVSAAKATYNL